MIMFVGRSSSGRLIVQEQTFLFFIVTDCDIHVYGLRYAGDKVVEVASDNSIIYDSGCLFCFTLRRRHLLPTQLKHSYS